MMFIIIFINLLTLLCDAVLLHEPAKFLIDPVSEDDNEEFELSNIMSLSEDPVMLDIDKYTDDDRKLILDLHNLLRSNQTYPIPKAADMNMLDYNKTLEWAAWEYLKVCKFEHGRGKMDNMSLVTSQNLYVGPGASIHRYMYKWYIEYLDYNIATWKCRRPAPGEEFPVRCEHFVKMMCSRLKLVGCARRSYCKPRGYKADTLVGCHYYPQSHQDLVDERYMYIFGKPCTRCNREDGNLCHKNLCVDKRLIKKYNLYYTCELNCQNCGVPDTKKCRCNCKKGWDYPDCGIPCRDIYLDDPRNKQGDKKCLLQTEGRKIRANRCEGETEDDYYYWHKCRATCGQCELISKKDDPKNLCCGGKICKKYSVLDVHTCQCKRLCPTFGCMYSGSDSSSSDLLLGLYSLIFIFFII